MYSRQGSCLSKGLHGFESVCLAPGAWGQWWEWMLAAQVGTHGQQSQFSLTLLFPPNCAPQIHTPFLACTAQCVSCIKERVVSAHMCVAERPVCAQVHMHM